MKLELIQETKEQIWKVRTELHNLLDKIKLIEQELDKDENK